MKKFLIILLFTLLVVPFSVSALVTYSGNHISINEPVNDDIFATGSIIEVNATGPEHRCCPAVRLRSNAPVRGDVVTSRRDRNPE